MARVSRRAATFSAPDLLCLDLQNTAHRSLLAGRHDAFLAGQAASGPSPAPRHAAPGAPGALDGLGALRAAFAVRDPDAAGEPGDGSAGAAVGHATLIGGAGSWRIGEVFVDPGYRRRGAGLLMVLAVVDAARITGCAQVDAYLPPGNAAARDLLRMAGFQPAAERPGRVHLRLPLPFFSFQATVVLRNISGW